MVSYRWSIVTNSLSLAPFLTHDKLQTEKTAFTYPALSTLVRGVKSLSDYFNACDHNPPTLQTERQTDVQTTFS